MVNEILSRYQDKVISINDRYEQSIRFWEQSMNVSLFIISFSSLILLTKKNFSNHNLINMNLRNEITGVLLITSLISSFLSFSLSITLIQQSQLIHKANIVNFIHKIKMLVVLPMCITVVSTILLTLSITLCIGGYYSMWIEIFAYILYAFSSVYFVIIYGSLKRIGDRIIIRELEPVEENITKQGSLIVQD
jgi:hypothetical protein